MHRLKIGIATVLALAAGAFHTPAQAQERDLIETARATLAGIQSRSFSQNREFCGLIGRTVQGNLVITRPRQGGPDGCRPKSFFFLNKIEVLASYHTHGAHLPNETVEVPSTFDLEADAEEGIFGFVSTPGGRFWIIEPAKDQVRMLCGMGCLPQDPTYDVASDEPLQTIYTWQELVEREAGG